MFKEQFKLFTDINEAKNLEPKARKWLKQKFGKKYTFIYNPDLDEIQNTYNAFIDGYAFKIAGSRFDTTGDGELNVVVYKILGIEKEEDEVEF